MLNESWRILWVAAAALLVLALLVYTPSIPTLMGSIFAMAMAAWYADRTPVTHLVPRGKAVVITGCDTGFGFELAHHLDAMGIVVFAGFYNSECPGSKTMKENCSERVHILQMDVTKEDQVQKYVQYVKENQPKSGLWGVVNNAGIHIVGDIELTSMEQYSKLADANILGLVRVTKAFLPLIRKAKGRVVNVSSVRGRIPTVFGSAYNITKYGVEVFSDILRLEMKKFGVTVCVVQPCGFAGATHTMDPERLKKEFDQMWESMEDETREVYGKEYLEAHIKSVEARRAKGGTDMTPVLDALADALLAIKPKYRYLVGAGWGDMLQYYAMIQPYLPQWMSDYMWLRRARSFPLPRSLRERSS